MTLSPLRVAAVQAESVAGDVVANVRTAVASVSAAAGVGARLVVLPEMFLSGYDVDAWRTAGSSCDVTVDDSRLDALRATARDHDVAVVVGAAVRHLEDLRFLSLLAFSPSGEISVVYSKQHLWGDERSDFTPGSSGASVQLSGWSLGLGICNDGCFPEHARAASDAGALAYLCPSAYVVGSEHRRDLYGAARALDNGIYVVMAGLSGRCGVLEFSGGTAIYDPEGRVVSRVDDGTGQAVADLDPAAIEQARTINPFATDRLASLGGHTTTRLDPVGSV